MAHIQSNFTANTRSLSFLESCVNSATEEAFQRRLLLELCLFKHVWGRPLRISA